jgi:hypothetical protein
VLNVKKTMDARSDQDQVDQLTLNLKSVIQNNKDFPVDHTRLSDSSKEFRRSNAPMWFGLGVWIFVVILIFFQVYFVKK